MTEDKLDLSIGAGQAEPGTYTAVLTSLVPFTYQDIASGESRTLLRWTFGLDSDDATEVEGITSTNTGPRSKCYAWIAALTGSAPKPGTDIGHWEDTAEGWIGSSPLVGRDCQVSVTLDDKGYAKVDTVVAMPKARK